PASPPTVNGTHSPTAVPPLATSNGELSKPRKKSSGPNLVIVGVGVAVALVLVAGGAYAVLKFGTNVLKKDHNDLLFHKVAKEVLEVTIVEKGQLEAAENRDVYCQVKASKGGNFSTTIKWVIDDGTPVKKGEKLVELDKSALEDQQKAQQSVVDKA